MILLDEVYKILLRHYGPQGWWPIINLKESKARYNLKTPRNNKDILEISLGAILTQSISFFNVEKALLNLKRKNLLSAKKIYEIKTSILAELIKPSGYYNQKAEKIKNFIDWFKTYNFSWDTIIKKSLSELRSELLEIKGIGPETADSILLYGLNKKIFVIDAYTKRIFTRLKIITENNSYEEIQQYFHANFKGSYQSYNEYHALIVEHAKTFCQKKPKCSLCFLSNKCFHKKETIS